MEYWAAKKKKRGSFWYADTHVMIFKKHKVHKSVYTSAICEKWYIFVYTQKFLEG